MAIRIGKIKYQDENGNFVANGIHPSFENYEPIVVMTKSSKYANLSPYCLKDEYGRLMEQIYQFSKINKHVPVVKEYYSRWDNRVIWEWPAEEHIKDDHIQASYWRWRSAGLMNKEAVRYPTGKNFYKKNRWFGIISEIPSLDLTIPQHISQFKILNWIEGRKQVYIPNYSKLVKLQKQFLELQEKLANGINLLIIEVDGPHMESLEYYKQTYGVEQDFIQKDTMLANPINLDIMLNDEKHSFGHGYCLAGCLLGIY